MPTRPLDTQMTGLAQHRSCRLSYLSSHLNFNNLVQPSFSVFSVLFSNPHSFSPGLSRHRRDLFFHFKAKCFHEQGQRGRARFAQCCCHLPPQFKPFCGDSSHCMNSHVLAGTTTARHNFWKALFFLTSENFTMHFFLLVFSYAPNILTQVLKSTPSVSTLSAAQSNHLTLSFLSVLID